MKKNIFFLMVLSMCILFTACSKDDDGGASGDGGNTNTNGGYATNIVINENGKASNGSIFSAVDEKNFYLDYIKYTVEEGHLVVSGYDKTGFNGKAKIVSSITYKGNSYEVLSINNNVFQSCKKLTSVTIPNSVTSIGERTFNDCSGLTSLIIGNSVTSIGGSAFSGCSGLTSLIIGNSVTSIGGSAFSGCSGLTSLIIGNSVTSIGESAFSGCSGLTSLTIPANVTTIGNNAFSGCTGLISIVVDKNNSVYDSRENCNGIIETATNTMMVECPTTIVPEGVTSFSKMVVSGQWQGDFGMYYGFTYPDGFYDEFDSYDTDLIFYPDYDYATHGYGYQVDWYSSAPNANGNVSPYKRLSYRFNWSVVNGRINLTYPGRPEQNITIRDYRLNNNHFTGYFGYTSSYFDLIKIADYYSWYDYDFLYRSHGCTYIEWGWDGGYYYNGVYYDYAYAKTRGAEATDSVGKLTEGRITKIGCRRIKTK